MHMTKEMKDCVAACTECANVCTETMMHCLEEGGEHAEANHIRLLIDCATICRTSAGFMLRGSSLHADVCGVCADVCRACGEECREMEGDFMQRCADACERCAQSCDQMAGRGAEKSDKTAKSGTAGQATAPLM